MSKASINPLTLYFQSNPMSLCCTPLYSSLQISSNAASENCCIISSGRGKLHRKDFRDAKFSSSSTAQRAEGTQITCREQAGRHWRSLYKLWGGRRAHQQNRKVKSTLTIGMNANGSSRKAWFCTKAREVRWFTIHTEDKTQSWQSA